jgi:phosphoribosylformimino-5-aminoimidazole carboxamide ribotide isomerase
MKIIPAIDLYNGKCVRLTRGNFNNITVYADPILLAKELVGAGVQMMHLCDLNRAEDNSNINSTLVDEVVKAVSCSIQMVGGIKNVSTVEFYLNRGVKLVVVSAGTVLSLSK